MKTVERDFKIVKGDSFSFALKFTDSNSNPIDLTGATFLLTAKEEKTGTLLFTCELGDGVVVATPANGIVVVFIGRAKTSGLGAGVIRADYDVKYTVSVDEQFTVLTGAMKIVLSIG